MQEKTVKLWVPVMKNFDTGEYSAILSDDSLDRDNEMMAKELVKSFAKYKSLKALANHDNSMQSWVGGWKNLRSREKGMRTALFANPWFFTEKANPLAAQIKAQVDEALEKDENPGISIGAIVTDYEMRKIKGKEVRVFTKGELLEATWVPIQSNRNASYGHIAKQFNKEEKMDKTYSEEEYTEMSDKAVKLEKDVSTFEKNLADVTKVKDEAEKALKDYTDKTDKQVSELSDKNKALETELTTIKGLPWYKGLPSEDPADPDTDADDPKEAEKAKEAVAKGMIPIVRVD